MDDQQKYEWKSYGLSVSISKTVWDAMDPEYRRLVLEETARLNTFGVPPMEPDEN